MRAQLMTFWIGPMTDSALQTPKTLGLAVYSTFVTILFAGFAGAAWVLDIFSVVNPAKKEFALRCALVRAAFRTRCVSHAFVQKLKELVALLFAAATAWLEDCDDFVHQQAV